MRPSLSHVVVIIIMLMAYDYAVMRHMHTAGNSWPTAECHFAAEWADEWMDVLMLEEHCGGNDTDSHLPRGASAF